MSTTVIIRGGGDLASGIAHRLFRSGFKVIVLELPQPLAIRRTVSFSEAICQGETVVERVQGKFIPALHNLMALLSSAPAQPSVSSAHELSPPPLPGRQAASFSSEDHHVSLLLSFIPVLVDPEGEAIKRIRPSVIVDARMAKVNLGTTLQDAPLVIGIGPGFEAGKDVHLVVETQRGHTLGMVIERGAALPDTGVPGEIGGESVRRLLRSPAAGLFSGNRKIGEEVREGAVIGVVSGSQILAQLSGTLRGILPDGISVEKGTKVADIDPRRGVNVSLISDKARSVGGGVLEGIMYWFNRQESHSPKDGETTDSTVS